MSFESKLNLNCRLKQTRRDSEACDIRGQSVRMSIKSMLKTEDVHRGVGSTALGSRSWKQRVKAGAGRKPQTHPGPQATILAAIKLLFVFREASDCPELLTLAPLPAQAWD